jgi:RNA polymerase sigma-70 factor (ECF subfamily)
VRGQTLDDAAAIRSCRSGGTDAFRHLVERYQVEAMGHAIAILGNRQDAEDALQEAFVSAYSALNRFDDSRRFYPWFYTILRNCCWKLAARRGKQEGSRLEPVEFLASASGNGVEDRLALEQALRELPPQSREVLTLRHLDGLSYEELAARLEIPVGTVMSRLFYARRELRARLGGKR